MTRNVDDCLLWKMTEGLYKGEGGGGRGRGGGGETMFYTFALLMLLLPFKSGG